MTGDERQKAVAFVIRNGEGVGLTIKGGEHDTSFALTVDEARQTAADLLRSLGVARHRREQGEWPSGPSCRHGDTLQGRVEHRLFYAMRDEFSEEEMDEYVTDYALAALDALDLLDGGGPATPGADQ